MKIKLKVNNTRPICVADGAVLIGWEGGVGSRSGNIRGGSTGKPGCGRSGGAGNAGGLGGHAGGIGGAFSHGHRSAGSSLLSLASVAAMHSSTIVMTAVNTYAHELRALRNADAGA